MVHWEHTALELCLTPGHDTHFPGEVPYSASLHCLSKFMVALPHSLVEPLLICVGPFPHAGSTSPGHLAKAVACLGGHSHPHLLPA